MPLLIYAAHITDFWPKCDLGAKVDMLTTKKNLQGVLPL